MEDKTATIEAWQDELCIYKGILFHNRVFENDFSADISYDFTCDEYSALRERYDLAAIAGTGSDFEKASRLTAYLAPKLTHKGDYDNHIACNALSLLEYSLSHPEHGINCLNKSKILQECCLALGIYARRVCITPYSPYDYDNHVVTEIYDRALQKWVMLDATANGYFTDENSTPLSVLEMREHFALNRTCNFTKLSGEVAEYFTSHEEEQIYYNNYFAKNLFYLIVDQRNGFGEKDAYLRFIPKGFDDNARWEMNKLFRLNKTNDYEPPHDTRNRGCNIDCLTKSPL